MTGADFGAGKTIAYAYDANGNLLTRTVTVDQGPYTINVFADPEQGGVVAGGGEYEHGTQVTVTAEANENYSFVHWTESAQEVSTQARYPFEALSDRDLTAHFTAVGELRVILNQEAIDAGVKWRIKGQTQWYASGALITLPVGNYEIEFSSGWKPEEKVTVSITQGGTTQISVELTQSAISPGVLMLLLDEE